MWIMQIRQHGAGEGCVTGPKVAFGSATGNMGCIGVNLLGCESGRKVLEVQEESLPSVLCLSGETEAGQRKWWNPARDGDG